MIVIAAVVAAAAVVLLLLLCCHCVAVVLLLLLLLCCSGVVVLLLLLLLLLCCMSHAALEFLETELQHTRAKGRVDALDTERLSMLSKRQEHRRMVENLETKNNEEVGCRVYNDVGMTSSLSCCLSA